MIFMTLQKCGGKHRVPPLCTGKGCRWGGNYLLVEKGGYKYGGNPTILTDEEGEHKILASCDGVEVTYQFLGVSFRDISLK